MSWISQCCNPSADTDTISEVDVIVSHPSNTLNKSSDLSNRNDLHSKKSLNRHSRRSTDNTSEQSMRFTLVNQGIINFKGKTKNGKLHDSHAKIVFNDHSYYTGSMVNGIMTGYGEYVFEDKTYSYKGEWKNGLPQGFGIETSPLGVYEGNFQKGKKWGNGKFIYKDGAVFIGIFVNNIINGSGAFYSTEYSIQEGIGSQKYSDGSEYFGQFKKGKPNGSGTLRTPDNKIFMGTFIDGKAVGNGQIVSEGKQYDIDLRQDYLSSFTMTIDQTNNRSINLGSGINSQIYNIFSQLSKRISKQI